VDRQLAIPLARLGAGWSPQSAAGLSSAIAGIGSEETPGVSGVFPC